MSVNFNNHDITTSGSLTALSGIFTSLQINGDIVATYSAGSGLELNNYIFNAKTATTSSSGITILSNAINSDENKALTPKAIYDAGYIDGAGTSGYLAKWSDSNTLTSGIIYDDGTNVGIGTVSATAKLHVVGDVNINGKLGISNSSMSSFNSSFNDIVIGSGASQAGATIFSTTQGTLAFGDTATSTVDSYRGYIAYLHASDSMTFGTFGSERLRINSTGIGIGTSNPTSKLHVAGSTTLEGLVRWEYPAKDLDAATNTLGYLRPYDEAGGYCGLGVSTSSFNIGSSGGINLRLLTNAQERAIIDTNGNFIFNENGNNCDFRIEGDTNPNLLFTDASVDRVGIGTSAPLDIFSVEPTNATTDLNGMSIRRNSSWGGSYANKYLSYVWRDSTAVVAAIGASYDGTSVNIDFHSMYNAAHKTSADVVMSIHGDGNIGIGTKTPSARLNVESGNIIFNDLGGNYDFRVEGDTDVDLLFTDASTDRVGISTATPDVKLQVNGSALHDDNYVYDTNGVMVVHPTPTSSTTLNDPKEILYMVREGTSAQAFGAAASFSLSRYENLSTNSRTRLDIDLAHGAFLNSKTNVMTMRSDGKVGIGTSSPSYKLDITGDIGLTNGGFYTSPTGTIFGTNGWVYQSGQIVNSQGSFTTNGDAQSSQYILRNTTSNATWTPLKNNNTNAILLASNRTYTFSINVVGRRTNGQDNAGYKLEGVLYNDGYGASIVGSTTKTVLAETDSTWDVRVSISGAGAGGTDFMLTEVLGAASKNINWVAKVDMLEVGGNISSYTEANILNIDENFIP